MSALVDDTLLDRARRDLSTTGFYIFDQPYEAATCASMIDFIDHAPPEPGDEHYYEGSERRIWKAHQKHPATKTFLEQCDLFMSKLHNADTRAFDLLAIRNNPVDEQKRALVTGRWHLDSLRRQLKIFLFLNGATEDSGPFEFIPGSHRTSFKLRLLLNGDLGGPGDFLPGRRRKYASIDDRSVQRMAGTTKAMVCNAGTLLVVDTSALHRARPCLQGTRYALTAYYR